MYRNLYDLKLTQQLNAIKLSWAACHVRWLKADETNVSRTVSVLILTSVP
jgi:hypothetical protein